MCIRADEHPVSMGEKSTPFGCGSSRGFLSPIPRRAGQSRWHGMAWHPSYMAADAHTYIRTVRIVLFRIDMPWPTAHTWACSHLVHTVHDNLTLAALTRHRGLHTCSGGELVGMGTSAHASRMGRSIATVFMFHRCPDIVACCVHECLPVSQGYIMPGRLSAFDTRPHGRENSWHLHQQFKGCTHFDQ